MKVYLGSCPALSSSVISASAMTAVYPTSFGTKAHPIYFAENDEIRDSIASDSCTDSEDDEHTNKVFAVDWSPDGEKVASGGKDTVLKLWMG
nr:notchless protein homolog isoform X1 [Ipomoea batatas]